MSRIILPGVISHRTTVRRGMGEIAQPPGPTEHDVFGSFTADTSTNFPNPERGEQADMGPGGGLGSFYGQNITLVRTYFRLDSYRTSNIPNAHLDTVRNHLANARTAGVKCIIRWSYNFGFEADAPLSWVLTHIGQLGPVWRDYSDVIAVLQAGFIGAWGEWHSSTNGLNTVAAKSQISDALLAELPTSRMIQIRTPYHIADALGGDTTPLAFADRFTTSKKARIGFKNDCFVTNSSDAGTYTQAWHRPYAEAMAKYTCVGGETCEVGGVNATNTCSNTLSELDRYSWDYLGNNFYEPVITRYKTDGCWDDMQRGLGYRFRLTAASGFSQVTPGTQSTISFTIANDGFGKIYNPRPLNLVFDGSGGPFRVTLYPDARRFLPLAGETQQFNLTYTVPSGLVPSASYALRLELPDGSSNLASDPRYSIRLANVGTWNGTYGWNSMGMSTTAV